MRWERTTPIGRTMTHAEACCDVACACNCVHPATMEAASACRTPRVVRVRALVAALLREHTEYSFPDIAQRLGFATHSGAIAAARSGRRLPAFERCSALVTEHTEHGGHLYGWEVVG